MLSRFLTSMVLAILFSCNLDKGNGGLIVNGNRCEIVHNDDSVFLGITHLQKDLFGGMSEELFPRNQYQEGGFPKPLDAYQEFEGIFINQKLFDCFKINNQHSRKISNKFDVVYIFPEESRYNFSFNQKTGYRVFHYLGFSFQAPSPHQNLPYYVQKIARKDNNCLLFTYQDKSAFVDEGADVNKLDTMTITTFPEITINFSNTNLHSFQGSSKYIRLSEEVLNNINLKLPYLSSPQDFTELYMQEIITKIINLRNNTKDEFDEIVGAGEMNSTGLNSE